MAKTMNLNILRIDGGTQSRQEINQEVVTEYAEHITAGAEFPAVTAFYDGVDYYLADGFQQSYELSNFTPSHFNYCNFTQIRTCFQVPNGGRARTLPH